MSVKQDVLQTYAEAAQAAQEGNVIKARARVRNALAIATEDGAGGSPALIEIAAKARDDVYAADGCLDTEGQPNDASEIFQVITKAHGDVQALQVQDDQNSTVRKDTIYGPEFR